MSGVCGILNLQGGPANRTSLQAMLDAGSHRGPDGAGNWVGDSVALGHLALHVTPEDRAPQPLVEGGLVIAADARIDNRQDLLNASTVDGGEAAGSARLILSAYRRWGRACVDHLIGDFAFGIWDRTERRLLLARDPMSSRPLYYRLTDHQLIFASEIAQILAVRGVPAELDELMVAAHLTAQPVALDRTFYRGIAQLPPGHALTIQQGRTRVWRYWDVEAGRRIRYRNASEYTDHFRELFKEAVCCRLRGDRPVGLMLSGGVDSGSVAATAGWLLENDPAGLGEFRTYSHAFERLAQCDERHVSRLITDRYRLPATNVPADDAFPLADHPENGPTPDAPTTLIFRPLNDRVLSRARADGVATMITGFRGDLLVGVYYDALSFLTAGLWQDLSMVLKPDRRTWRRFPKSVTKHLLLPALMSWGPSGLQAPIQRWFWHRMIGRPKVPPYPDWLRSEFAERAGLAKQLASVEAPTSVRNASVRRRYQTIFDPLYAFTMVDFERNHARHGLLHADPWSDRRLVEFVLAIPQEELNRPSGYKRLARDAMKGMMPEDARQKLDKVSLGPLSQYALQIGARDTITHLITDSQVAARGFVDDAKLQALYEAASRGGSTTGLWEILCLEVWLRRYWT
ncbi:asparagine synthase-related protein [Fodinicurvata sp. EGI_FJ10296]|uniref:asparagine synthase-related protein n=1 Tax=Fodinicurvata sp. EGI_FJ10296 TaxID=3231908 RepID=UPI003455E10E